LAWGAPLVALGLILVAAEATPTEAQSVPDASIWQVSAPGCGCGMQRFLNGCMVDFGGGGGCGCGGGCS
jgi:hypothetical protein